MEDTSKDQSSVSGNKGGGSAKLLRYPLRSGAKSKDDKPPLSATSTPASRRGKPSSVSQSVSVLDLSKDKSAKPPRRYSIPTKSSSPALKQASNTTPTSEARSTRSRNIESKPTTPVSEVSRSLTRKKFSVLSSASYWLSQIKLSEAAGKHQVSLGFFKLAQIAACENIQLLRDELKSYTLRHNILDLGESAKEVLQSYDISENMDKGSQISETCSHEQGSQISEDAVSLTSVNGVKKPKPKSLSNNVGIAVKENNQKKLVPNTKASTNKKTTSQQSGKMQKNSQKQITKESNKVKEMVKSKGKKSASDDVVSSTEEAITQENKENLDATVAEEISVES